MPIAVFQHLIYNPLGSIYFMVEDVNPSTSVCLCNKTFIYTSSLYLLTQDIGLPDTAVKYMMMVYAFVCVCVCVCVYVCVCVHARMHMRVHMRTHEHALNQSVPNLRWPDNVCNHWIQTAVLIFIGVEVFICHLPCAPVSFVHTGIENVSCLATFYSWTLCCVC